ncbi:unnamed protein product [Lepeophtheirus salmonis]|uniref:(salmon louse) hypothetical protein n=1 Tax=Lepeophtheirus salmonis TaxID=72036 RepID=A0A7R8CQY1_LEPSM|nr:unnamed protein product [Lepeophtheirus salmonis]CAF2862684.1 unnamed protein product [Lepeophtheirus salmonis]
MRLIPKVFEERSPSPNIATSIPPHLRVFYSCSLFCCWNDSKNRGRLVPEDSVCELVDIRCERGLQVEKIVKKSGKIEDRRGEESYSFLGIRDWRRSPLVHLFDHYSCVYIK